mgnify:CR=1 FL=1
MCRRAYPKDIRDKDWERRWKIIVVTMGAVQNYKAKTPVVTHIKCKMVGKEKKNQTPDVVSQRVRKWKLSRRCRDSSGEKLYDR